MYPYNSHTLSRHLRYRYTVFPSTRMFLHTLSQSIPTTSRSNRCPDFIIIFFSATEHHISGITQYILLGLTFSLNIKFLRFIQVVVCVSSLSLFLLNSIPLYKYTILFSPLMDACAVSSFGLLWIKLLWPFLYKALVDMCFHFCLFFREFWNFIL